MNIEWVIAFLVGALFCWVICSTIRLFTNKKKYDGSLFIFEDEDGEYTYLELNDKSVIQDNEATFRVIRKNIRSHK